jgi:hypothetical protein
MSRKGNPATQIKNLKFLELFLFDFLLASGQFGFTNGVINIE